MESPELADQDFKLWLLLRQTRELISIAREKELNQYQLSATHAGVLFTIQAIGEDATPAKISRWQFRKPHSITETLRRMQKEGLINMTKDFDKKNLIRVTLTDKGKQAYEKSIKRETIHRIMSSLSVEQRQQLRSYLKILRERAAEELGLDVVSAFL